MAVLSGCYTRNSVTEVHMASFVHFFLSLKKMKQVVFMVETIHIPCYPISLQTLFEMRLGLHVGKMNTAAQSLFLMGKFTTAEENNLCQFYQIGPCKTGTERLFSGQLFSFLWDVFSFFFFFLVTFCIVAELVSAVVTLGISRSGLCSSDQKFEFIC